MTEPMFFDGSVSDLRAVRRRAGVPMVRRDAIVHPAQVIEARAEGADAIVLVSAIVSDPELRALLEVSEELGMSALGQVHTEEELGRVLAIGVPIVLVNAREPESLAVRWEAGLRVVRLVPQDRLVVMEGGIGTADAVAQAFEAGATAVCVGTVLTRSLDPVATMKALRARD